MLRPGALLPSGMRGHAWEQTALSAHAWRSHESVLFSPCNWGPVLARRHVLVVHDAAPFIVPDAFRAAYRTGARLMLPLLLQKANLVLTVSRVAASDIEQLFGQAVGAKLRVVGAGVDGPWWAGGEEGLAVPANPEHGEVTLHLPTRFCLAVGGHDRRKNIAALLHLWPQVYERTGISLVVASRTSRTGTVAPSISSADAPEGVLRLWDPGDVTLRALYTAAIALLWPSRYEGFGLPLLEAHAAGTRFIAGTTGAASELATPYDHVVPIEETDAWISAICAAGADRTPPGVVRARLRESAKSWSWGSVARRVMECFEEVAAGTAT